MFGRPKLNHKPHPNPGPALHGKALLKLSGASKLPSKVDLRPKTKFDCYNQGSLGSCTANAAAAALQFLNPDFVPSRLYLYYGARALEGTTDTDAGALTCDIIKTARIGVPSEDAYPYDISKFADAPPVDIVKSASAHRDVADQALVQDHESIKACLASGYPAIIGIDVYESFFSDACLKTGNVPIPNTATENEEGGHCVAIWGYDDSKGIYIVRNSWGISVGDNGYFYVPYAYADQYLWDPWVVHTFTAALSSKLKMLAPDLTVTANSSTVHPGQRAATITITNNDKSENTISISLTQPALGDARVNKSTVVVGGKVRIKVPLIITVPSSAIGTTLSVGVTIISKSTGMSTSSTLSLDVSAPDAVIAPPTVSFNSAEATGTVGDTNVYPLTITNPNLQDMTVKLTCIANSGITGTFTSSNVTVPEGSSVANSLTLTIPVGVTGKIPVVVSCSDSSDPPVSASGGFLLSVTDINSLTATTSDSSIVYDLSDLVANPNSVIVSIPDADSSDSSASTTSDASSAVVVSPVPASPVSTTGDAAVTSPTATTSDASTVDIEVNPSYIGNPLSAVVSPIPIASPTIQKAGIVAPITAAVAPITAAVTTAALSTVTAVESATTSVISAAENAASGVVKSGTLLKRQVVKKVRGRE